MRLIDADALRAAMYHEAFENDASYDENNPMAKWDSGLWVRYKMFERCLEAAPSIDAVPVKPAKLLDAHPVGVCSECGFMMDYRDEFNYCPNCGSKMEKQS